MITLKEALDISPGEVISLVGGGGKTTLMFALARELAESGLVVTTTTTRIVKPTPEETPLLLVEPDEAKLVRLIQHNATRYRHITVAAEIRDGSKLKGISPKAVVSMASLKEIVYIISEADGSKRRPLKAPNATEPVISPNTSLVIVVLGMDAVDCPLTEEKVFRPEIAAGLLGLSMGATVTAESIARLVTHPAGIAKGSPPHARIIPFLNKVDLDHGLAKGRELARQILALRHPQINKVVLGQVQHAEPVAEVIQEAS
ncbi:MAG: putative selenium-dependent hydroxylase accessory protein YqeC [Chloroflexi bacterium]|nr:putative selenium-dependent hydroxylase accessory protein YqeC [Chloroflexota bacterium]